jgi:hypothetical protein
MIRPTLPIALFLVTALLQTAHADQTLQTTSLPTDLDGVALPDVDRETLVADLEQLRSALIRHKRELAQQVEDRKLNGNDALITAIMPGGLLYAGIRKARYENAKGALAALEADIAEMSADMLAMQDLTTTVAVAQLPQ